MMKGTQRHSLGSAAVREAANLLMHLGDPLKWVQPDLLLAWMDGGRSAVPMGDGRAV